MKKIIKIHSTQLLIISVNLRDLRNELNSYDVDFLEIISVDDFEIKKIKYTLVNIYTESIDLIALISHWCVKDYF